jgi:hypothetical protein
MRETLLRLQKTLRIASLHGRANRSEFLILVALIVAFEFALITLFPPEGQRWA